MLILHHRINCVELLRGVSRNHGVEIDVQFYQNKVYLGHDPGKVSIPLETYLEDFEHSFLAINVKQEGIEEKVLQIVNSRGIPNYFLFDVSFPFLMRMAQSGQKNLAIRLSDYELIRRIEYFVNRVQWIWLDIFDNVDFLQEIKKPIFRNFKICAVSPELHTYRTANENRILLDSIMEYRGYFEAVCTKEYRKWLVE